MKRLTISPIPNNEDHGDDPFAYLTTFCEKDMDMTQLTSCRDCDYCCGIFYHVKCCWEEYGEPDES